MKDPVEIVRKMQKIGGEIASNPLIAALSQATPITAGIAAYFAGAYQQQQQETIETFMHLLDAKIRTLDQTALKNNFIESADGKRIIAKVLRSVIRDNRIEKIEAMANATINSYRDHNLSIDSKELFIDILDALTVPQVVFLLEQHALAGEGNSIKYAQDKDSLTGRKHHILQGLYGAGLIEEMASGNDDTFPGDAYEVRISKFGKWFIDFVSSPDNFRSV